jgi:beta-glucosidase
LVRLAEYGRPIYLTEFGIPDNEDRKRPRFIVTHVAQMHRAIAEGVPLRGAYFWSLVDNFEWAAGWSARFGLIALDPATQARRLTRSAEVYRRIATANGLESSLVAEIAPDLVATLNPVPRIVS